ncbi:MAG: hypothetical protein WC224_03720 [Sphaerochaetaceae bacterium]
MAEFISILLSIVLFTITLIVVFTFRSADRRERRLEAVRKYAGQYMNDIKEAEGRFQEVVGEVSDALGRNKTEIEALFTKIFTQREELFAHSEDLNELQKTFVYYQEVLEQLSALTNRAEQRVNLVRGEIEELGHLEDVVESVEARRRESTELLEKVATIIDGSVEEHKRRLEGEVEVSLVKAQEKLNAYIAVPLERAEKTFQAVMTNMQAFMREMGEREALLSEVVEKLSKASLNDFDTLEELLGQAKRALEEGNRDLETLDAARIKLELQIVALNTEKEVLEESMAQSSAELQSVERELESAKDALDLALAERERLKREEEERELQLKTLIDDFGDVPEEEQFEEEVPEEVVQEESIDLPFDDEQTLTEQPEVQTEDAYYEEQASNLEEDEEEIFLDDE